MGDVMKIEIRKEVLERVIPRYQQELIIPKFDIERFSYRGKRFYKIDDGETIKLLPSVTTVFSETMPMERGLLNFFVQHGFDEAEAITESAQKYGTFLHDIIEWILLGNDVMLDTMWVLQTAGTFYEKKGWEFDPLTFDVYRMKQDILGFLTWCADFFPEPMALEYPLYTEQYAGVCDFVGYITNKSKGRHLAMIDWKSGRHDFYENNIFQLHAYKNAWDARFPDIPIEHVYNYAPRDFMIPIKKTVTPYNFKDQSEANTKAMQLYIDSFFCYEENYVVKPKIIFREGVKLNIHSDLTDLYDKEYDGMMERKDKDAF